MKIHKIIFKYINEYAFAPKICKNVCGFAFLVLLVLLVCLGFCLFGCLLLVFFFFNWLYTGHKESITDAFFKKIM